MTRFIDANVIVKAFTQNVDKEKCRAALYDEFITNTLCVVEAQHAIWRITGNALLAANCVRSLFKGKGIIVPLDKNLLFEALKGVGKYRLGLFDLIHYVSALLHNCSEFISYDKAFENLEIRRVEA